MGLSTLAMQLENTSVDVFTGIGIVISVLLAVLAVFGYKSKFGSESKNIGKQDGIILTQLAAANTGITDIKREMSDDRCKREEQRVEMATKLALVEASSNSAHKRIDSVEENIRKYGQYDPTGLK